MGGRSTIVLAVLVILVGAYLWYSETPPQPAERSMQGKPPGQESLQALHKLLDFEPADVVAVQVQRTGQSLTVQRQDSGWQGVDDPSVVNDFLHTLSDLRVLMDISVAAQSLKDYGLDPPLGTVALRVSGQAEPLILQIGERNPATTGVYVRLGESGAVVLAGALVEWEFDKLFKRLSAPT